MSIKLDKYTPLMMYLSPASIPQIVAHIQDYLVKHPILSVETIAEIIVQSLQEHPELINGEAIPISADSAQSIKAYIDALPALDTYTKAEINALLLGKQDTLTFDQAPTPGSSNPVTSSGIIAALSALQATLETLINAKADSSTTYTKTQVDTLLEDKADADDVYSKNTMDAKLLEVNTDIDNLENALNDQSQQIDTLVTETIPTLEDGLAIVADGNEHVAIAIGQFVYVKNHTENDGFTGSAILADGLYTANENIGVNADLTTSNLAVDSIGGLNALYQRVDITTSISGISGSIVDIIALKQLRNVFANIVSITKAGGFNAYEAIASGFPIPYGNSLNCMLIDLPSGGTPAIIPMYINQDGQLVTRQNCSNIVGVLNYSIR